ncbi:MAG: AraC family transcriptional regulator [Eubacteriales bacterium]|nr:AraC family transcriptional regulator [Eubacteriales bacterium]
MSKVYKFRDLPEDFPFAIKFAEMEPYYCMDHTFHWHNYLEISYVKQGIGRYYIGNTVYDIAPGDIIVINNIEPHYMEVLPPEPMIQPVVMFDPRLVSSGASRLSADEQSLEPFFARGSNFSNKIKCNTDIGKNIFTLLTEIEMEYRQKNYGYELMIKSKLLNIFTYLIRNYQDEGKSTGSQAQKNRRLDQLQIVFEYIDKQFAENITLDALASLVFMTPSYFCTFFKNSTGFTPTQFIHKVRISKSIEMLKKSSFGIFEIAYACGFNNLANFNRTFKRTTGQTPSAIRSQLNV